MKKSLLCLLIAGFITACSSESSDNKKADTAQVIAEDTTFTATNPPDESSTECYAYTKNRDTITMKLNISGEELTGELNYRLFEKDKNKGTFAGEMKGDTIIAEYMFDSEGMRSIREVIFLKKAGKLYEGFGDIEDKSGKVIFKDHSKLTFGNAIALSKVPCN